MKTKKGYKLIEKPQFSFLNKKELNNIKGGDTPCPCNIQPRNLVCPGYHVCVHIIPA